MKRKYIVEVVREKFSMGCDISYKTTNTITCPLSLKKAVAVVKKQEKVYKKLDNITLNIKGI